MIYLVYIVCVKEGPKMSERGNSTDIDASNYSIEKGNTNIIFSSYFVITI